jgi:hypothetical protein
MASQRHDADECWPGGAAPWLRNGRDDQQTHRAGLDVTAAMDGRFLLSNSANLRRTRALASFNRTHNFRVAWLAELPFGAGKHCGSMRKDA